MQHWQLVCLGLCGVSSACAASPAPPTAGPPPVAASSAPVTLTVHAPPSAAGDCQPTTGPQLEGRETLEERTLSIALSFERDQRALSSEQLGTLRDFMKELTSQGVTVPTLRAVLPKPPPPGLAEQFEQRVALATEALRTAGATSVERLRVVQAPPEKPGGDGTLLQVLATIPRPAPCPPRATE